MTKAGADIVVAHMGVTTGGSIGATSAKSLDDCVGEIDAIADAARSVRKDVILLCHGGPISMPDDARYILERCRRPARLLRRVEHGAAAGGSRDRRADQEFQGDRLEEQQAGQGKIGRLPAGNLQFSGGFAEWIDLCQRAACRWISFVELWQR